MRRKGRRPEANRLVVASPPPLRVTRVLSDLGTAFAGDRGMLAFAQAAAAILADSLLLEFIELRTVARDDGAEAVLTRRGEQTSSGVEIELAHQGARVGTLTVRGPAESLLELRTLSSWLAFALGALAEVDRARSEAASGERSRAHAMEALFQVIQHHSDAVYLFEGGAVSALNSAAERMRHELPLLGATTKANDPTASELVPIPAGALLFRTPVEPSHAERARSFVRAWDLTTRQEATLLALIEGKANKEVAVALDVSVPTVERHLTAMFRRTGVRSRGELVAAVLLADDGARGD